MKIPETSANVGAYYGSDENGQWQPNGMIMDSGVPGGVVGSGDGLHPQPVYPVHIPRGHIPGYVMAGAYYAGGYPAPTDDFADYMWMENEEEFDKQVMQQLEEEALMEQCIEAMLEDEQRERRRPVNGHAQYPTTSNGNLQASLAEAVSRSTLNPLAAEFVPTRAPPAPAPAPAEDKSEVETSSKEEPQAPAESGVADTTPAVTEDVKTEEPAPEASAERRRDPKKEKPRADPKKAAKPDPKKTKPSAVKSETKVQPKKKEVKAVKSETKAEVTEKEAPVIVAEVAKTPATAAASKPINYAAAARANKPKAKPAV